MSHEIYLHRDTDRGRILMPCQHRQSGDRRRAMRFAFALKSTVTDLLTRARSDGAKGEFPMRHCGSVPQVTLSP